MDSGAGESGTLTGARLHSAVLLQGFVEFSEVSHCQLCEWFRSQAGLHVVFHIPAIVFQRARPESDRHLLQPCVQPFPESHFALLRQVNALVGIDILAELCVFPKTMKCLSVLHKLFAPLLPSARCSSGFSLLVQLLQSAPASRFPMVSTTMCRLRPFVFFHHLFRVLLRLRLFLRFASR